MNTLGNVLWNFPFFGFMNAIMVYLFGLMLTITVVAAPIGLGLMEYGKFLFAPFGREMVSKSELNIEQNEAWKKFSFLITILWLPVGVFLCLGAIIQILLCCLTIVGIPVGVVVAKSLGTYFNPVNKKCVHAAVKREIERQKGQVEVEKYLGSEKKIESEQTI